MKRILATLLVLIPAIAGAAEAGQHFPLPLVQKTITGTVEVKPVMCIPERACPPLVSIKTGNKTVQISGDYARDLAGFAGKVVTVKGTKVGSSVDVKSFAPGKVGADGFVTGKVIDVTNCPANARCKPRVALETADGHRININGSDEYQHNLANLIGATVTLRGDYHETLCPMGAMCLVADMRWLVPDEGDDILVRGNYRPSKHGMNGVNGELMFENGSTLSMNGKSAWADRAYGDVWVAGSFGQDKISHTPIFFGDRMSNSLFVGPAIDPFPFRPLTATDGSNVSRDAGTNGAVAAGSANTTGAGVAH